MNILTIDLEDWFHLLEYAPSEDVSKWSTFESRIEYTTEIILECLEQNKTTATFFVLGWVAENYPGLVEKICLAGHHVGSHSHQHKMVHNLNPALFKADLEKSCYAINKRFFDY